MAEITASLAYRPRGSTTWVAIDPSSTTGRRFLRSLGIITDPMEDDMTAASAAIRQEPRVRLVDDNAAPSAQGLFLRLRAMGARAWQFLTAAPRRVWNSDAMSYPRKAAGFVGGILGWIKDKALLVLRTLGGGGLTGVGLLAVSTSPGRWALNMAFAPVRFAAGLFGSAWHGTQNFLSDHLGAPGNWVANRMWDVEAFLIGSDGHHGLVGRAHTIWSEYLAPWLTLEGIVMNATRFAGYTLLALKVGGLIALLPLGGLVLTGAQYLGLAGMGTMAAIEGWSLFRKGFTIAKALFAKEPARDSQGRFTTVESIATGEETPATMAANAAVTTPEPAPNRQARRGNPVHGRKATSAAR